MKRDRQDRKVKPSKCIRCLEEVALETFLRNDHVCDPCADLPPAHIYKHRSNNDEQTAALAALEAL